MSVAGPSARAQKPQLLDCQIIISVSATLQSHSLTLLAPACPSPQASPRETENGDDGG